MSPEPELRQYDPRVATGALIGASLLVSWVYFSRFVPASLLLWATLWPAAVALLISLASFAVGALSIRAVARIARGIATDDDLREVSLHHALLIGFPLFGTLMALLAAAGMALRPASITLTFGFALGGCIMLVRRPWQPRRWTPGGILLLGPPILVAFIGAIAPVNSPDELIYKLAVPHAYQMFGAMVELPLNSNSYFPLALNMVSLPALYLAGGIAAKLIFFLIYLCALATILDLARELSPEAAPWTAAVIAWTPALMLIAGWAWAEWGVIGLLLLSFLAFERFIETPDPRLFAVSVLAMSGALASKYTALPWLVVFIFYAGWRLRSERRAAGRIVLIGAAVMVIFGGFFYFRNWIWTGSPIAPFGQAGTPRVGGFRSDEASGWQQLLHGDDIVHPAIIDDSLGILMPVAILLSPFALLGATRREKGLFFLGAVQTVGLVSFAPLARVMTAGLIPLVFLGSRVMGDVWKAARAPFRLLMAICAAVVLPGQFVLVAFVFFESYDFVPYLLGRETASQYIARTREFSAPYAWIERETSPNSRILLLGEIRTFHLDRQCSAAGNLDGPRVVSYLSGFRNEKELAESLQSQGFTHILLNRRWYQVEGPALPPLSMLDRELALRVPQSAHRVLSAFLARSSALRYREGDYLIYELAAAPPAR